MPGTQTQTQTQVETEQDKNVPNSAPQMLAAQLTNTRSASTFACGPQEPQVSEAQGNQAGPKGPGGDDEPSDGGKSPPQGRSPRDGRNPRRPKQSKGSGPPGGGGGDGGGSSSGSGSSYDSSSSAPDENEEQQLVRALRRSRRDAKARRYKEEEFKCPPMPELGGFRAWKNAVQQNTAAASGRPDNKAVLWVQTAFDKSVPEENLKVVPRRFAILSRRMAAKFQSIGTGQLGLELSQIVEVWLLEGQTPPALILLRTIVNYYDTGSAPGVLYNILDLQKLAVRNGNLEGFINSWYMMLRGMNDKVDPKILEHLFFEAGSQGFIRGHCVL